MPDGISTVGSVDSNKHPTFRSKYRQSGEQRSLMPSLLCK